MMTRNSLLKKIPPMVMINAKRTFAFVAKDGKVGPKASTTEKIMQSQFLSSCPQETEEIRPVMPSPKLVSPEDVSAATPLVLQAAMQHFSGKSLYLLLELEIPDLIGDETVTVPKLIERMRPEYRATINEDALLRVMRFVAVSTPFLELSATEDNEYTFSLTAATALLQTNVPDQPYLGCAVQHHNEMGMSRAWAALPR